MDIVISRPGEIAPHRREAASLIRFGLWVLVIGIAPVVTWLMLAPLSSAVVAPAVVKVDLNRRPVQHAEGGMVREVRVRDGQRVEEGDALVILGDVAVDADMQRWEARVNAERASIARLEAEQGMLPGVDFPAELRAAAQADRALAQLMTKEQSLFDARRNALTSQIKLLRWQREKVMHEVRAMNAQITSAETALQLQNDELGTNRRLKQQGFVAETRLTQLEAQVADYAVKLEERRSDLARAEQKMVDNDLRIKAIESEYRQQASDQLKVTLARLAEVQQEQRKTGDAAKRQVITAPASGEIMGLKVNAPGAVISPRETIAEIVPAQQRLIVESTIRTQDINQVRRGQHATMRFTAFAYRTTPLVEGIVTYVSADRMVDQQSGNAFYVAHVEVDGASLKNAGDMKLQAGMPAELFIEGEKRTPMQYLLQPISQLLRRAGREL